MKIQKIATIQQKEQACKLFQQGWKIKDIAYAFGFHWTTVGTWVKPEQAERKKQYFKEWEKRNPEKKKARARDWVIKHRKSYERRHKLEIAARRLVKDALKIGKLIKRPCEKCGNDKTHAHHENYLKPLDVIWLCDKHHRERHRELNNRNYK